MRTEIRTQYIGATNTRGSRIKATGAGTSASIPYPHELSGSEVHRAAAQALVAKLQLPAGRLLLSRSLNRGWVFTHHAPWSFTPADSVETSTAQ